MEENSSTLDNPIWKNTCIEEEPHKKLTANIVTIFLHHKGSAVRRHIRTQRTASGGAVSEARKGV
jgi:hypothetical protein